MRKRFLILNLILIAALLIGSAAAVYAYFTGSKNVNLPTFSASQDGVIEIDSEYELLILGFDGYTNYGGNVSAQRRSVKLTEKITLTQNIIITADINIDLGGEDGGIDLNGYSITFRHFYDGCFLVTDGVMENSAPSQSYIYCDTPNAFIIFDCAVDADIIMVSFDADSLVSCIFDMTDSLFDGFYSEPVGGTDDVMYFINRDLTLSERFYNYDIELIWESADTGVISHDGKITAQATDDTYITITVTVSGIEKYLSGGESVSLPLSKAYYITALYPDNIEIGRNLFERFLSYYKYGGDGAYYIYGDVELPNGNSYYNIEYGYTALNPADTDGRTLKIGSIRRIIKLTVRVTDTESSAYEEFLYDIYAVTADNYKIVNDFIDGISPLKIYNSDWEITLISPEKQQEFFEQGVSVEFSVVDGEGEPSSNYYIENGILKVGTLPQVSDLIYLKAQFTFLSGAPRHIERLVRINYISATMIGGDEGADYYASHVAYLNERLLDKTGGDGRTFTSFDMPSEITENSGKVIGVEYELISRTPNLNGGVSQGKSCLVYDENAATADADYVIRIDDSGSIVFFEINIARLKASEADIEIKYTFISEVEGGETQRTTKDNYKGGITLHGIIRYGAGGIPDQNLYSTALAVYDTSGDDSDIPDGYITLYEAGLPREVFKVTDTVGSFKGLEFFTRTVEFVFDGTGNGALGYEPMDYLGQLENVTRLSLINNDIDDGMLERFVNMRNLVYLNLSENLISDLGRLGSIYGGVETLDLSYNNLSDLSGLERFVGLKTLHLEGNEIENFRKLMDMPSMLYGGEVYYLYEELTYEDYIDGLGKYSVTTFVLLTQRGLNIYYDREAVEFSDADLIKAANILESILIAVAGDTFLLPQYIYYNGGSNHYKVTWDLSQLSGVLTSGTDELTVTHTSGEGSYIIYASVTSGEVTAFRPFYIGVL